MPQRREQEVDKLYPDLYGRLAPDAAFMHVASLMQALPAVRGAWVMSGSVISAGNALVADVAGGGFHLTRSSVPTHGFDDLAPYVNFDGANDELRYVNDAQFNITGTETHVRAAYRGLTLGGWFDFDDAAPPADVEHLIGVWNLVEAQRSYRLFRRSADGTLRFIISTGAASQSVTTTTVLTVGPWHFCVGRFDPSAHIDAITNDVNGDLEIVPAATAHASLNAAPTANFTIGAILGGTDDRLDGRAGACWVCAAELSDDIIRAFYEDTRSLYKV